MRLSKALFKALDFPLKYISAISGGTLPKSNTRNLKVVFKINPADREPSPATEPSPLPLFQIAETYCLDLCQALDEHVSAGPMISISKSAAVDRWLTILETNRTMALSPHPILPFTMYPLYSGGAIRFLVGPTQMPFDVHVSILAANSPAFDTDSIKSRKSPFALSSMTPADFGTLTKWLYDTIPPTFTCASDLQRLCELWVAASQLGIWGKANTLMRLGMALMTPSTRVCPDATVRWVFAHTPMSSHLRSFIIAIYAQRSQPDFATAFVPGDMEIWTARTVFMRKLEHARKLFAFGEWGLDGTLKLDNKKMSGANGGVGEGKLPVTGVLVWNVDGDIGPDTHLLAPEMKAYKDGLVEELKRE
jgi:hypothetical protein